MRILYYGKASFGDCDFPLVKALMDKGHEVIFVVKITPYSLNTTIFELKKQYSKSGVFHCSIYPEFEKYKDYIDLSNVYVSNETSGHLGLAQLWHSIKEIVFIKKTKADVIQHVEDASLFNAILLWFFRKKLVFTIHDGRPHTGDETFVSRIIRKTYTKYARKFVLLTRSEGDLFMHGYNVKPDKIRYSHLGYYEMLSVFGNNSISPSRQILFFGRITPYKGIDYLLKAMLLVHDLCPDVRLIVAGSGQYSFDTSDYQQLEYMEFRNRYIGLDELADLIRGSLITVCPYTEATQSGVVYSSLALNTPVVATNVGGLPGMIDNNRTGVIIPPCDIQILANTIVELVTNKDRLNNMREQIQQSSYEGPRSWGDAADAYIKVYDELLD